MMGPVRIFLCIAAINLALATGQERVPSEAIVGKSPAREPWGQLEVSEIPLSCPDPILRVLDIPSARTTWIFKQPSIEEIQVFLSVQGFTEEEISYLVGNSDVIYVSSVGTRLYPDDELINNMPVPLRQKLYRILSWNPKNRFYNRPLYLNSANVSEWFRNSGVPRIVQSDIARVAYPTATGRGFFLSDVSYLLRQVENSQDEQTLLRALMRRPTLIVHLKLDADSDLEALSDYWSAGFKNKDILPLMESVVETKEINRIDITHFLPPTPRRNLLSFPSYSEGASGRYPDWFWTCYNFFRFTPSDVYADSDELESLIARDFAFGLSPLQFGDMLLFRDQGKPIHGCIYIADDIVYTKNSADIYSPWILMRIDELLAYHDMNGNAEVSIHRKRLTPAP